MLYVKKISSLDVKNPVLIYGVGGGMGNVAEIVAKQIIEKVDTRKIYEIRSDAVIDRVFSNSDGVLDMIKYEIYTFKSENQDFLLFYGSDQPLDIIGRYELVTRLIRFAKKVGVKEVLSIGGFGVDLEPENPKVYLAGTNKEYIEHILQKLSDKFDVDIYKNGDIAGMSGLLVSFAGFADIPGIIFLAETYPTNQVMGYFAAKKILDIFSDLYGLEIDTTNLAEEGRKLRETIKAGIKSVSESKEKDKSIYYFG